MYKSYYICIKKKCKSAYNSILNSITSESKTLRPPSEMVHDEKQQEKKQNI